MVGRIIIAIKFYVTKVYLLLVPSKKKRKDLKK